MNNSLTSISSNLPLLSSKVTNQDSKRQNLLMFLASLCILSIISCIIGILTQNYIFNYMSGFLFLGIVILIYNLINYKLI